MIEFEPFKGWRYNSEKVNFNEVIAPPYDVISPEKQKALYGLSPYNCIRLILNKIEPTDSETQNRYTRSRDFYKKLKEENILIQDSVPAFYLYKQIYPDLEGNARRSRFAIFGRLKLEPFEKGIVIPHEKTLSGPKKDRLALMEAAEANFSPIFGLFPNADGISEVIEKTAKGKPLYQVKDEEDVEHTLWMMSDESDVQAIREGLGKQKAYIADGHHRYTTSLNYAQKQRELKGAKEGEVLPSDYTLAALVHFSDPGLVLEPTHRILKKQENFDVEKSLASLNECFEVKPMSSDDLCAHLKSEQEESRKNPSVKRLPSFGILFGTDQAYLLTVKDAEKVKSKMPAGHAESWYRLDVNLVNYLVLSSLWGFDETKWEAGIAFTHSDQGALESMGKGEASAVFILKAPPVEVLEEMGNDKELMPQKSTYFYPKLASGFLFHHHG